MRYDYCCTRKKCGYIQEHEHSVNGFKEYEPKCPKCNSKCKYKFTATIIQFALKDGPSGSWPSKGEHFKNYRRQQSENIKQRQYDRYGPPKMAVPNFKGEICESWKEAESKAVRELGPKVAPSYKNKIAKARKSRKP
jgi:hypothetical protein